MALGQPERGIDELRAALDRIRGSVTRRGCGEHGGPWERRSPQTGQDDDAAAAAETVRAFAATLAQERAEPLLAADPSREILSAAGSG